MGSFSRTQSPVLVMPPSTAHQAAFGMPMFSHQPSPLSRPGPYTPSASRFQQQQQEQPILASSSLTKGRKRSRDEAAINLDVEEAKLETIEPVTEAEDEWVYGPGMVLIKKSQAYVSEAGSQSGTWVEEKIAQDELHRNEEARAFNQQERPSLRSAKSQRLDMNSYTLPSATQSSSTRDINDAATATPSLPSTSQPVIDNFTLHLGIGWSRVNSNEHSEAAARGWARYIENHFPINNVQIQLESKGLQSYLVEASEGFFLFAEDLQRGQFVSRDLNQTFQNLRASPPVFEGLEVMIAAGTPQPTPSHDVDVEMA
ncbi:hypothetical protein E8E14_003899 [Neopestalotiopsis sp. 37M]|nr:hypothetical protein E8E14_003899 [Neopestalotiopsis sp. 37M]